MKSWNPNLFPPSGFIFFDSDGFRHSGNSWKDLERKVREYREMQGIPVGDVKSEIMTQACERNPGYCQEL